MSGGGRVRLVFGVLAVLSIATAAGAQDKRFVVSVGGGASFGTLGWSRTTSFSVYQETAQLDADQQAGSGAAFEGGIGYRISRRFGVRASYAFTSRDVTAAVRATIPHPFFFDTPRSLEASLAGLDYREQTAHVDVEVWPVTGRFELGVFVGAALLSVEADLVERVEYDEEYPYDTVTFRSANTPRSASESTVGWSAGAIAAYTLAPRWGLAVQARYTKGSVDLSPPDSGASSSVDAGGWRAVGMLRFGF